MYGNALDLISERNFRTICEAAEGEFGEYVRSPGGHRDMGCRFEDDVTVFVDEADPWTGEEPRGDSAVFTTEVDGHIVSSSFDTYNVEAEPDRLEFNNDSDIGGAMFTGNW